ncbi:putative transporter [Pseudoloma neurophilia]|uniref:Putative transporter n=1 Tax=Pseudoloma neurophilia TaxID=146866 RepID=A0A0R0LUS9_9MICR|nr:putative transporter [Pseudoloma neurophilia]
MEAQLEKIREKQVFTKVYQLTILYILEMTFFAFELLIVGKFANLTIISTQKAITISCNSLYIISALIFRRTVQFRLYPVVFAYTICIPFLNPFSNRKFLLFFELAHVLVIVIRGIWVLLFYKSFQNIFDWQNFLKFKSNKRLIGKYNLILFFKLILKKLTKTKLT